MKRLLVMMSGLLMSWMMMGSAFADWQGAQHELMPVSLRSGEVMEYQAPFPFQAFSLWDVEGIEVRFLGTTGWTPWKTLEHEEEEREGSALLFVEPTRVFALRSERDLQSEATLIALGTAGEQVASLEPVGYIPQTEEERLRIISRREWGADESIGTFVPGQTDDEEDEEDEGPPENVCEPLEQAYPAEYQVRSRKQYVDDLGRLLIWPRSYSQDVEKIVIHHTAQDIRDLNDDGRINETDYRLGVKAIHTFHTLTRGWGDIGYHYLVDPDGNIYEGRAGGRDVIAAHVLCQNSNTVGVAVMGNFEEDRLKKSSYDGLVEIVDYLSKLYQVDPLGESQFRGSYLPNIVTHAEVGAITKAHIGRGATSCPGGRLVSVMGRLRSEVANGGSLVADYAFAALDTRQTETVMPLEPFELAVTLKNAGQQNWREVELSTRGRDAVEVRQSPVFVGPGDELEVKIPLTAGLDPGRQRLVFDVLLDGRRQSKRVTMNYSVRQPVYRYDVLSFEGSDQPILLGERRQLKLKLKNSGNFPWPHEGEHQLRIRQVDQVRGRTVLTRRGLDLELPKTVYPGDVVMVPIELPVQRRRGTMELNLMPMIGRMMDFEGEAIAVELPVEKATFAADVYPADLRQRLQRGFEQTVQLALINKSNYAWDPGTVWVEADGADRHLIPIAVDIGGRYIFPAQIRAGYADFQVQARGSVGIDEAPSRLDERRFRKDQVNFLVDLRATGAVRLMAEYRAQSRDQIPNESGVYEEWVDLLNTGTVPWYAEGEDRTVLKVIDRGRFRHRSWRRGEEAGVLEQEVVMPGEVGRFQLSLQLRRRSLYEMEDAFQPVAGDQEIRLSGGAIRFATEGRERRPSSSDVEAPAETGSSVQAAEEFPPLRVWLTGVDQSEVELSSPGSFILWESRSEQVRSVPAGEHVQISTEDLADGTVYRLRAEEAPYLEFQNWDRIQSFGAGINDNRFRDVLEFRLVDGQLTAINELPLESYMKGIAEVPESDDQPEAKRKVIAVLARSYALHYLIGGYEKFPGKPYNAADSPDIFQKYLGYNFEERSPKWQQALRETTGEVVLVDGILAEGVNEAQRVLRAAYFSCTDGLQTRSGIEVWPDNRYFQRFAAVFQSVADPLGDDPDREGLQACGHQVGLSGYGATQMAKEGMNYREIIQHYYQGVEVRPFALNP